MHSSPQAWILQRRRLGHDRDACEREGGAVAQESGSLDQGAATVDVAAVRASLRQAAVENEVERRVAAQMGSDRVLRIAEVMKATRLGRTTIWELEQRGEFPRRRKLTARGRAVGWLASDVARWIAEREAARTS